MFLQERRMKQQREVLKKQKETADKIASRAFAQSYLADLVPSVFGTLADNGYFYDPVERGKFQNIFSVRRSALLIKVKNYQTELELLKMSNIYLIIILLSKFSLLYYNNGKRKTPPWQRCEMPRLIEVHIVFPV